MNIFEPTMTVPPDVAAAADKLTNYFADRDFSEWRLNGCASRDQLELAEGQLARTASENEALAQRLAIRMEELQQAVQARLAAEKERDQLLVALTSARRELQACQAVIHLAGGFDPAYVTGAKAALSQADAAIAAVKGEKPTDDRSVIEEFVAVWFEATEEWVAVLPNGHVLRGKWGAVGYAVNAALEYLGRGEAEFDVLDLGGDGPTFRYVKNDEHWQEGGAQ